MQAFLKPVIALFIAGIIATGAFAQSSEVVSAFNYLKYNELDKAKTSIDAATLDAGTSMDAKTWFYRGNVYLAIATSTEEKFKTLDPNSLTTAFEAYQKAKELDVKKKYTQEINERSNQIAGQIFNRGIGEYRDKKYNEAVNSFSYLLKINPSDTAAILNTALAAERAGNNAIAKEFYGKLVAFSYPESDIYRSLANIYKAEKDTTQALVVLAKGRTIFPDNVGLIIEELNIYLAKGQSKEAIDRLEQASAKDPSNKTIKFALGSAYENLKEPEKAEKAYLAAIAVDSTYFDAYYNLGAMHYNQAVEDFNKANNLPPSKQKEYDAGVAKAKQLFTKALPYLEKALLINPKDRNTLISLKEIYARTNQLEKSNEIKKKLGY